LCIFESSSWDFVHFWKFLMAKHTRVPNTDRVDAEEADHSICLAKMSLIRTKPDHFYDMIWFFTYIFFLTISNASKLWLQWTIDDSTILRTLWTFLFKYSKIEIYIWTDTWLLCLFWYSTHHKMCKSIYL
jgi:hypothetical protein